MPISLGTTTITALFLGTTSISSAYLGNTQVFGGSFSPLSLFSGGAQGVWYDPSDLTTMFVDRAGTTPVTAPGQLVGLRLDKSKGLALGAERIADPTLTNQTGWTVAGDWVSVTGGFEKTAMTANSNLIYSQGVAAEVGKTYLIEVTINTASSLIVYFGTSAANGSTSFTGVGTFRQYLTVIGAAGSLTLLTLRFITASTGSITAASVRELAGNHATAPTDAARPMYGVEPKGGRRNLLTWSEDFGNAAWVKTNVTVATEATTAPDGTTTADKIVQNTGAGGYIDQSVNISNATAYTFSAYAKQAGYRYVELKGDAASGRIPASAYFDLQNGVVSSNPSGTADIVSVGSGWFRCSISATSTATGARPFFRASTNGTSPATGNGTDGVFIWGAQLERDA